MLNFMRSRVKICGITRLQDAQAAISAGADALGFVFYKPSPRYIDPVVAKKIISSLPPFVTITALFVNEEESVVNQIIQLIQPDLLQFHGDEDPLYCAQFDRPYIKALRMADKVDLLAELTHFRSARAILLDTYVKGVPGGTGATFNWQLIPESICNKIILAGGLDCHNVGSAIEQVRPYAVDVSGGLEAEKGIKSLEKITKFMSEVNNANKI